MLYKVKYKKKTSYINHILSVLVRKKHTCISQRLIISIKVYVTFGF